MVKRHQVEKARKSCMVEYSGLKFTDIFKENVSQTFITIVWTHLFGAAGSKVEGNMSYNYQFHTVTRLSCSSK